MKSNALQTEVFKAILTNERRVKRADMGNFVAFTTDGYTAFVVPKSQVCIDLSKIPEFPAMKDFFSLSDEDVEVRLTKIEARDPKGNLLKLACDKFSVWVQKSLFNKFYDGQAIFCTGPVGMVKFRSGVSDTIDAVILPVRFNEEQLK